MTKGQQLIAELRRRWMTYGDMQALRISTSPHKRVMEALRHLREGESLTKRINLDGLVMWKVVRK